MGGPSIAMSSELPDLSVVIPAYNEEQRLPRTFGSIRDSLAKRGCTWEIIVVDDGSTDGTARVTEEWRREIPAMRLVANGRNRGKGYSVRHGMLEARGRIALFTDADLSAPIEEADKLFAALEGASVAIGSRAMDRRLIEVHQSRLRESAGIIFNFLVRMMTGLPFADTQCGFKAFRREPCRIIFEQQQTEGFGFDPEILFLAKRHALAAVEVPVRWSHSPGTKVRMGRDSLKMLLDVACIRWNVLRGRYPRRGRGSGGSVRTL